MSLSKAEESKFYTGRVIMGLDSNNNTQERTIQEMEGKKKPVWDEDTDKEYFERVKAKAQSMAKDLITQAMAEAETIKAAAQAEGYAEGKALAAAEAEKHMIEFSKNLSQTLTAIQEQSRNVVLAQSTDAVSLILMVIEKTLAVEMESRRQEILASLLDEALSRIDSLTQLVIKVAPADYETVGSLLEQARAEHPDLTKWRVKADPALDNGGVIIEAEDAMIDNTVTSRWEGVQEILGQLTASAGE
ncbi:FliH/SctL family protein [Maridesulfovibrio hydrothermalis]|uniref:Flagellar assembly protein FliH n=1 Tax=Maridesulfovibrio hydrothermalis AM13 = DSM 14728 TaxID=1121451 RepID=L0RGD9_9BACT|nr:FliH/SctL family protein [Maridesulfovibrio hydrothermalis]CCO25297.1 putative Flagellar assembly protein FliH [Maridesulfovibrio hydrothermalis AM13 = DSM 14728]